MIAKIKTRTDFGGIVNYANDQKNKKKCATLLAGPGQRRTPRGVRGLK